MYDNNDIVITTGGVALCTLTFFAMIFFIMSIYSNSSTKKTLTVNRSNSYLPLRSIFIEKILEIKNYLESFREKSSFKISEEIDHYRIFFNKNGKDYDLRIFKNNENSFDLSIFEIEYSNGDKIRSIQFPNTSCFFDKSENLNTSIKKIININTGNVIFNNEHAEPEFYEE